MKLLYTKLLLTLLLATLILVGCSPYQPLKKPIEQKIEPKEIPVEEKIETVEVQKPVVKMEKAQPIEKKMVRVGLSENVSFINISFYGDFSVSDGNKEIFNYRSLNDTWRIIPQNSNISFKSLRTDEEIVIKNKIILTPADTSYFKIWYDKKGKVLNNKGKSYRGKLEIINISNRLTVVNELSLDEYLFGVVPSEMSYKAPYEALKAQAVVARTNVFSNLGKKYDGKPYDLTSDVYSQVYGGVDVEHTISNRAVLETSEQILTYNDKPIEAVFHAVCGGHTESNHMVWSGNNIPYLKAKPDYNREIKLNLNNETNFKKFIDNPNSGAYCNMEGKDLDPALNYARKYFRWEVSYSREKFEELIKRKTGRDIGRFRDIIVISRGESGKIRKLKVMGTKGSVTLFKELNIRKNLSPTMLYSANFYVQKEYSHGYVTNIILKGAGHGHGAGMCQIGACGMASEGKNYIEILEFYYPETKLDLIELK